MRRQKLPPGTPDDTEAAFYDALAHGDLERLMGCWADEDEIVCVHPGGPRIVGHAAIRAAFDAMFANGVVRAYPEKVRRLDAGHYAVHSVVERVEGMGEMGPQQAWVVATNVYAKTAQGWRLVAHHASPGVRNEPVDVSAVQPLLH